MSSIFLPMLTDAPAERASTAAAGPHASAKAAESWRAVFEQADGQRFGGWFQGPTDQPDAGASAGAARLPAPVPPTVGNKSPVPPGPGGQRDAATVRRAAGHGPQALRPAESARRENVAPHVAQASPAAAMVDGRPPTAFSSPGSPMSPAPASGGVAGARAGLPDLPRSFLQVPVTATREAAAFQPVAGPVTAAPGAASLGDVAGAGLVAMLQSFFQAPVTVASEAAAVQPGASPAMAAPGAASTRPDSPEEADASDAPSPADDPRPAERAAGASTERDAVRLHAEWTDAGVRLWLGVDAGSMPDVAALAAQLQRWLGGQGMSLLGLVCNGRDVFAATGQRDSGAASRPLRRGDASLPPFDFSNLYSGETK